jgi:cobalt/nickel transport system permease protein
MTLALAPLGGTGSPLCHFDQRWKLAAALPAVAAFAVLRTLPAAFLALIAAVLLLLLARLSWRHVLHRLGGLALFMLLFVALLPLVLDGSGPAWELGPMRLSLHGLTVALVLWCKALAVASLMLAVLVTSPLDVTLKAAHALLVPGFIVQLLMLTYRYTFLFVEELGRLRIALRVRGYRNRASVHCYRTIGNVTGTLLVRSHERAERVGQAMRCRGFDGRFRSLATFRTRWSDVAGFLLIIAIAGSLLAWDLSRGG